MNFQMTPVSSPVKILIVNPLFPAAQMMAVKILSGEVLGRHQLIDLILLVYSNEKPAAEIYKMELLTCAFVTINSITITSDIPKYSDADVILFMSTLKNPNYIDFENIGDDNFDALYLIIKIANSLSQPETPVQAEEQIDKPENLKDHHKDTPQKPKKPTIIADGLVTMSILYNFSHNLPSEIFFCPSSLGDIAKSILGEILKTRCNELNNALVWAADNEIFHVEIEKPFIVHCDDKRTHDHCEWLGTSKEFLESLKLDHVQFNESWMKKEFIEKVQALAVKNPYGSIYKATENAKTLRNVWRTRTHKYIKEFHHSMGVISDGSLDTYQGCAYILPLIFIGDTWSVNHTLEESSHVKQEIKRINKRSKEQHIKLMKFCKKFLKDNILNQASPKGDETGSVFSLHSSRHTTFSNYQ